MSQEGHAGFWGEQRPPGFCPCPRGEQRAPEERRPHLAPGLPLPLLTRTQGRMWFRGARSVLGSTGNPRAHVTDPDARVGLGRRVALSP